MLKAGALLYAMFLIIVVTIISSSFILLNYYNSYFVLKTLKEEQLFQDVRSGVNYGLTFHKEVPLNSTIDVDLFDDEQHKVTLEKKSWGAFFTMSAHASWRNKKVSKTALIGESLKFGEKVALHLCDQNKPLSLTGKTNIVGDCYLPESGVKRAYIEGKSFVGKKLINGLQLKSNKVLPALSQELLNNNETYFSQTAAGDSIIDYELLMEEDSIINSFSNKTLVVHSTFPINIENKVIEGNVIVKSDQLITISSSTKISNAIFYAKGIIVEKNTKGNMQLFAQDSILVQKNCNFYYPSVLGVIGRNNSGFSKKLYLEDNVQFKGTIFLFNKEVSRKQQSLISIGERSKVMGQVYASELFELKGELIGSVYCKKTFLKTPSSVYENHLMDVVIDRKSLSPYFIGASLLEKH